MSSRRNRDRSKSALSKVDQLPSVSYEEVANATYGTAEAEVLDQWFGDISQSSLSSLGIQVDGDGAIAAFAYRLTGVGLDPSTLAKERENWAQLGQLLFRFDRSMQWLIGDWLLQGERNNWGKHEVIAEELGYEVKTLYDYRYVARNVDFSVRTEKLSFGHHKLVAHLAKAEQKLWLDRAVTGDFDAVAAVSLPWSINRLRKEMLALPETTQIEETPFERNLRRIDREMTRKKWNRLPADERRKRYDALRAIVTRMERWGLD